jgi:hypothetical protein
MKITVTIRHITTQQVEKPKFNIKSIEKEKCEKRHYTSTNRWISVDAIKNGYVVRSHHARLISDTHVLDYIAF